MAHHFAKNLHSDWINPRASTKDVYPMPSQRSEHCDVVLSAFLPQHGHLLFRERAKAHQILSFAMRICIWKAKAAPIDCNESCPCNLERKSSQNFPDLPITVFVLYQNLLQFQSPKGSLNSPQTKGNCPGSARGPEVRLGRQCLRSENELEPRTFSVYSLSICMAGQYQ